MAASSTKNLSTSATKLHSSIFSELSSQLPTKLFINNQWVDAEDGSTFEVLDPTTELVLCKVAHAKKNDVEKAVTAARGAFNGEARRVSINRIDLIQ